MHIGHPTELTPAALDLDRTLALVEPLYQDRSLATGEPFWRTHAAPRGSWRRCEAMPICFAPPACSACTTFCASPMSGYACVSVLVLRNWSRIFAN